jgi:phosphoribosyl-ATP pyrophosphohydrolase/phosphoribosyl-AMP cyclohydrolase
LFFLPAFAGLSSEFMLKKIMQIPNNLKYDDKGLIPAVVQDWQNGQILMVAYMNAESLKKTVETRLTWFWSRSRQKFWQKGETSGHIQRVKDILYDCTRTRCSSVEQTGRHATPGTELFLQELPRQEG